MVDPGFPRGGGANPKGGAPTYYLANFSRKLHENEEILGRGGARVPRAPLRSATEVDKYPECKMFMDHLYSCAFRRYLNFLFPVSVFTLVSNIQYSKPHYFTHF